MIMDLLVTGTTVAAAYGAGFWLGKADRRLAEKAGRVPVERAERRPAERAERRQAAEEEWEQQEDPFGEDTGVRKNVGTREDTGGRKDTVRKEAFHARPERKGRIQAGAGAKKIMLGRAIGSPVTGEVSYFHQGTRKGALIHSSQGKLYAPASGKIVRLYPTGNCMRLRTEYGVELLIQAGIQTEELEGLYYRPRVVQNEVVSKGKLLLEYDPAAIRQEGYDPAVIMSVEEAEDFRDITVSDATRVKNGEDIMWVRNKAAAEE